MPLPELDEIDSKAAKKNLRPVVIEPLRAARDRLAGLSDWRPNEIGREIHDVAAKFGINIGKLGQPIRVAVTGGPVSPPIDVTVWLIGQERIVRRLDRAIGIIEARAAESA